MQSYIEQFARAWFWTVSIETLLLLIASRYQFFKIKAISIPKLLSAGIFASSLTLPYLWFVGPELIDSNSTLKWVGEPLIYLMEALFYMGYLNMRFSRAIAVSSLCNTGSLVAGLLFYKQLIGS